MNLLICHRSGAENLLPKRRVFADAPKFTTDQQKTEAKEIKERITGKPAAGGATAVEGKVQGILKELAEIQKKVATMGKETKTKFIEYIKGLKVKDKDGAEKTIVVTKEDPEEIQKSVNTLLENVTNENAEKNSQILRALDRDLDGVVLRVKFRQAMVKELELALPGDGKKAERERIGALLEEQMGKGYANASGKREGEIGSEFGIDSTMIKERIEVLYEMQKYAHMIAICERNSWVDIDHAGLIVDHGIAYPQEVGGVAWFNYWVETKGDEKIIYAIDNVYGRVQKYDPKGKGAGRDAWVWVDETDASAHDAAHADPRFVELSKDPAKLKQYKDKVEASIGTGDGKEKNLEKLIKQQLYERTFITAESREYKDFSVQSAKLFADLTKAFDDFKEKHGKKYVNTIGKAGSMNLFQLQFYDHFSDPAFKAGITIPDDIITAAVKSAPGPDKGVDKDKKPPELGAITKLEEIVENLTSAELPWGDTTFSSRTTYEIASLICDKGNTLDIDRLEINGEPRFSKILKVDGNNKLSIDTTTVSRDVAFKKGDKIKITIRERDPSKKIKKTKELSLTIGEKGKIDKIEPRLKLDENLEFDKEKNTFIHYGEIADGSIAFHFHPFPPGVTQVGVISARQYPSTIIDKAKFTSTLRSIAMNGQALKPHSSYEIKVKIHRGTEIAIEEKIIKLEVKHLKIKDEDLQLSQFTPQLRRGSLKNGENHFIGSLPVHTGIEQKVILTNKSKPMETFTLTPDATGKVFLNSTRRIEVGARYNLKVEANPTGDPSGKQTKDYSEGLNLQACAENFDAITPDLSDNKLILRDPVTVWNIVPGGFAYPSNFKLFSLKNVSQDFKNQKITGKYDGRDITVLLAPDESVYFIGSPGTLNTITGGSSSAPKKLVMTLEGNRYDTEAAVSKKEFTIDVISEVVEPTQDWVKLDEGAPSVIEKGNLPVSATDVKVRNLIPQDKIPGMVSRKIKKAEAAGASIDATHFVQDIPSDGAISLAAGKTLPAATPDGLQVKLYFEAKGKNMAAAKELPDPLILRIKGKPEAKDEYAYFKNGKNFDVVNRKEINGPDYIAELVDEREFNPRKLTKATLYGRSTPAGKVLDVTSANPDISLDQKKFLKLEKGQLKSGQKIELEYEIDGVNPKTVKTTLLIDPLIDTVKKFEEANGKFNLAVEMHAKNLSISDKSLITIDTYTWEIVNHGYVTRVIKEGDTYKIKEGTTVISLNENNSDLAVYLALALNKLLGENKDKAQQFEKDGDTAIQKKGTLLGWNLIDNFPHSNVNIDTFVALLNQRASTRDTPANVIDLPSFPRAQEAVFRKEVQLHIPSYVATHDYLYSLDQGKTWEKVTDATGKITIDQKKLFTDKKVGDKFTLLLKASSDSKISVATEIEYEVTSPFNEYEIDGTKKILTIKGPGGISSIEYNLRSAINGDFIVERDSNDKVQVKYRGNGETSYEDFAEFKIDFATGNIDAATIAFESKFTTYKISPQSSEDINVITRDLKIETK